MRLEVQQTSTWFQYKKITEFIQFLESEKVRMRYLKEKWIFLPNYKLSNYYTRTKEKSETPQLCIAYVWFTSANVISLKVWSITKIVINSNCDNVTMTEKINERSAYNALWFAWMNQPKKKEYVLGQRLRCNPLIINSREKKRSKQIFVNWCNFFIFFSVLLCNVFCFLQPFLLLFAGHQRIFIFKLSK